MINKQKIRITQTEPFHFAMQTIDLLGLRSENLETLQAIREVEAANQNRPDLINRLDYLINSLQPKK